MSDKSAARSPLQFPDPPEKLPFTGERYVSGHEGPTQHAHHHRYLFALPFCTGKSVLDVACGEGYGASLLASVARSVLGVDADEAIVEFANQNYASSQLRFLQGMAQQLPVDDGSIDVVVSFETIEHFSEHEEFMSEIRRVLKPAGLLVISSPNRPIYSDKSKYSNPFHERELDLDEFETLLRSSFRHVKLLAQRQICGSYILPPHSEILPVDVYSTEDSRTYEFADSFASPQYFVAVASDGDLQPIAASVLSSDRYVADLQSVALYEGRQHREAVERNAALEARLRRSEDSMMRADQVIAASSAVAEDLRATIAANAAQSSDALGRIEATFDERLQEVQASVAANATRFADALGRIEVWSGQRLQEVQSTVAANALQSGEMLALIRKLDLSAERRLSVRLKRAFELDAASLRSLRIRATAACRHPLSSEMRREVRHGLRSRSHGVVPTRAREGRRDDFGRLLWRLQAAIRHPFSSDERRAWRSRNDYRGGRRTAEVRAAIAPLVETGLKPADPTGDPATALHATLFERWVSNALGEYPASEFVPLARTSPPSQRSDVKLIAYYLPQFHPIPENDLWWGKGFTEWRNVARAYPQFEGHYQPRIPGELGYYDLRVVDVMRRQVELAKLYGMSAFCFHFYWFGGKTLLETPVRNYLDNKDLDLPFCLCWANENWSRRWDGSEHELLITQSHSPEDDDAFLKHLDRYFRDERYLKIDGRPVLTVYRPSLFPDPAATVARWRELAQELGYPDLYLIATNSFAFSDYERFGFDALSEFPPHHVRAANVQDRFELSKFRTGWRIRSYAEIVETEKTRPMVDGVVHPGIMTSWDNSARRPASGEIIHGATPELFKAWLKQCFLRAEGNPAGERLIFVNAWNEWAEGTYLEPDKRFGYGFLDACASAVRDHVHRLPRSADVLPGIPEWCESAKTILLCSHHAGKHIFGGERSFLDVLRAMRANGFNVVVTLQEAVNESYVEALRASAQEVRIYPYSQWTADASSSLASERFFRATIDEVRPNLVYINTIMVTAPLVAARLCGVPTIVHAREIILHDEDLQRQIGLGGPAIVAQVMRSCVQVVANSQATARCFKAQRPTAVIPNIVDLDDFDFPNEIDGDVIRFGLISSNYPKKGVEDVIELARLCEGAAPAARFLIIGPHSRPLIREFLTGEKMAPKNVEFVDYESIPQEALSAVNVVLNFSHFQESFGRTILEGMAAGRPCIVYDWGALPELIEQGVSGFMVPYRQPDKAVEFVKALCEKSMLRRMGQAARERAWRISDLSAFSRELGSVVRLAIEQSVQDIRAYAEVREKRLAFHRDRSIDIVICVHDALNDVTACLASVVRNLGPNHRIILVDDGSAEETRTYLEGFSRSNSFTTLHRNDVSKGYTCAANLGANSSAADLFILLNSDTIVTPSWAEKLADAVFSVPGAGIVGPLSNAASYQSLPSVAATSTQTAVNSLPAGFSPDDMNEWCEMHSTASVPCVPLVHGFCFGITREAWETLGQFDEEAFPHGYGEENDYCFRAVNAGFALVLATHTYVFHAKSKSYSEKTRHELADTSQKVIYARHGRERFMEVVEFLAEQPALRRLRCESLELWRRQNVEQVRAAPPT